jgi:alkylation response protein AidB-like acyl-CoA dehydrogenase
LGLSLSQFARVSEELGRTPLGHYLFNCQAPDAGNMEILMEHGTAEQKERWLGPLVRGEIRSCFAMTEPECAGSNPVWMNTRAVKEGADYVINGHKWFTSGADGAAFAIVMAITNPEAEKPHHRASQIIVPADTPGFKRVRNIPVMGEEGEDYASHAEIVFENCRVPQQNLLGEQGKGFAVAQQRLGPGRIHHSMRWIGICERAFELMCERAATRQLSPGKPLASRQIIQEWIADSRAEIHAARLMVLNTAETIDRAGSHEAREEISLIKFFVAGVLQKVLDRALQVHGAVGMTDDLVLSYWYRHERGARIYDGPDEVHKALVARMVLKKYGFDVTADG